MFNFRIKFKEETRYGMFLILSLLALPLLLLLLNFFLGGDKPAPPAEKAKEKTVIVTAAKQDTPPPAKPPAKSVVATVRDAIKQGNYSTAYLVLNSVSKTSPEYEQLNKQLTEETRKRKAPGIRKEAGTSPSAPIRYLDESSPRDRTTDGIYIYFVDISGTLWPRFCIQNAAQRPLGITGFTIIADNKIIELHAPSVTFENIKKGVAEVYDVPLDRRSYEAAQAMTRAKKVTLTITGSNGTATRDVTDNEKKGFHQILDGFAALGGNLNYLKDSKSTPATPAARRP